MSVPKIIHHCWFGGGEYPELVKRCLASWSRVWPGYEVRCWNESNSPRSGYLSQALENKKYANASNLVRLQVLYQFGGVYLDVDVEAVSDFGDLLEADLFVAWESHLHVNNAVMGAVPQHPFVLRCQEALVRRYDGREEANLSSPVLTTEELGAMYGDPRHVADPGVRVLPREYFYPYGYWESFSANCLTPKTVCVHHWLKSWKT